MGFHVSDGSHWEPGPYGGFGTLTLHGEIFSPVSFKYPYAAITLSGAEKMKEGGGRPYSIGSINARDDLLRGYISVPTEYMSELTSIAVSGHLQVLHIIGSPLRYRHASVRSVNLTTRFDAEEW